VFTFIDSKADLEFLNSELLSKEFVGVDTEFRRTNKNNMRLGLLQINDTEEIYLVDTVIINNPKDECSFLFSNSVIKVFHSCKEDIEAVYAWTGRFIKNIFDTQIANEFLGGDFSESYQSLVRNKLGISINKNETRSNWLRRPLTDSQLHYAASDVEFLTEIYKDQSESLTQQNKINWLNEEIQFLTAKILNPQLEFEGISNNLTKKEEMNLLNKFNELVISISQKNNVNPTLFFSKKIQKEFLRIVLSKGIDVGLNATTEWRSELIERPLKELLQDL
jgi:ribonuclease D